MKWYQFPRWNRHIVHTALLILLFSTIDAFATYAGLANSRYSEANPWMSSAFDQGLYQFFLYKTSLVFMGLIALLRTAHRRISQIALRALLIVFVWVCGNHVGVWLYYNGPEWLAIWY
jgi:hypothetical protein